MKRFVIKQYGYESLEYSRAFVLEVPDHMTHADVPALDEDCLAVPAEEAGIAWDEGDLIGPEPDRHQIEGNPEATRQLEVVKWTEEIK
jgi:hypothetical protein